MCKGYNGESLLPGRKKKLVNWQRMKTEKETVDKSKRQPTKWEKIFANDISDKGLVSKIYKELIKLTTKETNKSIAMFTCQEQPEIHDMHTSLYLQNNPANYYSPLHKRKLRVMVQPLWKTVWRFLKELKIDLPYDPAIAVLGIYPKDTDAMKRHDTCTPTFIEAMSTIAKLWKKPRCPSKDEWIKKM